MIVDLLNISDQWLHVYDLRLQPFKTVSENLWPEPNPAVPVAIPKIVYGSHGNLSWNTIIWVTATPPIRDVIYAILKPVDRTSVGYNSGAYIKNNS